MENTVTKSFGVLGTATENHSCFTKPHSKKESIFPVFGHSYSYYLRINGNHLSVINKCTILQWFITLYNPPGQTRPALC